MTDRELWVKTLKTAGAMVGGTVVFLGSISLVLLLGGGGHATASSQVSGASGVPAATTAEAKSPSLIPTARPRHGKGEARPVEAHAGESI